MELSTKYPRTYHLPFSTGLSNDDRKVDDDWKQYIINQPIVITEKLDGSNSCITRDGVYARSHATFTENLWDRNLTEKGGLYDKIKHSIAKHECIYGENLYGIHSIEYNKLPDYFFMFSARYNDNFYSWEDTKYLCELLDISLVPVLYEGKVTSCEQLETVITELMEHGSEYGDTIEGVVVRNVNKFHVNDFSKYVCKYVRENHVQTDAHWRKNWKRAKLVYEYENDEEDLRWKNYQNEITEHGRYSVPYLGNTTYY